MAVTGPPPKNCDFKTRVIGGSRSPLGYPTHGVTFGSRSMPIGSPSVAAMRTRNRQQTLDRRVRQRNDKQHPTAASLPLRCAVVPSCPKRRSIDVPFLAACHHCSKLRPQDVVWRCQYASRSKHREIAGQTKERSLTSKGQYRSNPRMHQRCERRVDIPSIRRKIGLRRLVRVGAMNRIARI